MKLVFKTEGLDCPICAKSLDEELKKMDEIENVKSDFLTQKLEIETNCDVDIDSFFKLCAKRVKKFDSDVKLIKG